MAVSGNAHAAPVSLIGWLLVGMRGLAMVILLIGCVPLYYLWHPFTRHNPWPRYFMRAIARIAGLRITVEGQLQRQGTFILANHISWLDIPALAGTAGSAFVAQDGLTAHGWLHWLGSLNDTVFIARHDRKSVARQVSQVREAIRDTGSLAIFPEGTTADGIELLPFKSSLLSAITPVPDGILVQPVLIDYGNEARDIAWTGEETGLDNFIRIAARTRRIAVSIRFLEPLTGHSLTDRKTIAATAREAIDAARSRPAKRPKDQRFAL